MTDVPAAPGTWGAFLAHARGCGVELLTLELPDRRIDYLARGAQQYPLPYAFAPDRKMGFWRVAHVCRRLGIPEPAWPIEL